MAKNESIFGWHFVGDKLRDGSEVPRNGVWLPKITPISLCAYGYHGSLHPFDALRYAPGDTLCYCEYRGEIEHESDKFVAEERRIITRMDAADMLRYFARMQALSVAHLWEPPDIMLDWLMTGDESLRAAAWAAAWDAARAAAWAAAWDAARAAAWDAVRDAARDAAWDAVRDAAWDAVRDVVRDDFADLVYECFGMENPHATK